MKKYLIIFYITFIIFGINVILFSSKNFQVPFKTEEIIIYQIPKGENRTIILSDDEFIVELSYSSTSDSNFSIEKHNFLLFNIPDSVKLNKYTITILGLENLFAMPIQYAHEIRPTSLCLFQKVENERYECEIQNFSPIFAQGSFDIIYIAIIKTIDIVYFPIAIIIGLYVTKKIQKTKN